MDCNFKQSEKSIILNKPKMNNKTGCMEKKFISAKGTKGIIVYPTCPWNNCEFFNWDKKIVLQHIKTCIHGL